MSAVRSKNSGAEMRLRRAIWKRGYRYRLHSPDLPGRPDLVFRSRKVVIFVDGDFWHGRILVREGEDALRSSFRDPAFGVGWWFQKIRGNVARDTRVTRELDELGWTVVRVWESEIKRDLEGVVEKIAEVLG